MHPFPCGKSENTGRTGPVMTSELGRDARNGGRTDHAGMERTPVTDDSYPPMAGQRLPALASHYEQNE